MSGWLRVNEYGPNIVSDGEGNQVITGCARYRGRDSPCDDPVKGDVFASLKTSGTAHIAPRSESYEALFLSQSEVART